MKRAPLIISSLILAVAIISVGIWRGVHASATTDVATQPATQADDKSDEKSVAAVQTTPIHVDDMEQSITAYGSVSAEPGAIAIVSVTTEIRVVHLAVSAGQSVKKGDPLLEIEASADSLAQLSDARSALDAAKKDMADTQSRFDLKLATNAELLLAKQTLSSAQAKLDNLEKRGVAEGKRTLSAQADGFISKIDVQEGQQVAAGAPLVELLPDGQVEVRLGVEPADAQDIQPGQAVELFPADSAAAVEGQVHLISHRLNPDTRLMDVYVTPPPDAPLLLDSYVRGELALPPVRGMTVPRAALLPADTGYTLFTVKDDAAVKHTVYISAQNDTDAVITGDGLHDGDPVVTQGNLQLDDGTAVSTDSGATDKAATTEQGK